jgi:hypothetical protein
MSLLDEGQKRVGCLLFGERCCTLHDVDNHVVAPREFVQQLRSKPKKTALVLLHEFYVVSFLLFNTLRLCSFARRRIARGSPSTLGRSAG